MRSLIEQRLATLADALHRDDDPRKSLLRHALGPVSPDLEALLSRPSREAAVLLPIVARPTGLTVLFTARSRALPHHAGQVCFPGGGLSETDETAEQAALREAQEEIGLDPVHVDVVGRMRRHLTGTGFVVTPFVGFVAAEFEPVPDPGEVERVFEVPLARLLEPGAIRVMRRERFGTAFRVFEFDHEGARVWGATAAMLVTLIELISEYEAIR